MFWKQYRILVECHLVNQCEYCILRLSGFANPLSLQAFENDDLALIENFVRKCMLTHIGNMEQQVIKKEYFGTFYESDPSEFTFLPGERKLILQLAAHVKSIVYSEKGFAFFNSNNENDEISSDNEANIPILLTKLLHTVKQNGHRDRAGFRYDIAIKHFATYIRMVGGRLLYQTLHANMYAAIPSLPSVDRYIHKTHSTIIEGIVRSDELLLYLKERNLPLVVSLSEDATRIVGRVQYSRHTNQLIGFTLPIDKSNGLPVPFSYPARNFNEIVRHFTSNHPISSYANMVMAQPLGNVAAFCLLLFGSDNKYDAHDVCNRWTSIGSKLNEDNIKVLTIVSDSDPKFNAAMRILDNIGIASDIITKNWFSSEATDAPYCLQDIYHIGTKLRNFLLKTAWGRTKLPFGHYFIDVEHLRILLRRVPKDQHRLTDTVINPVDRQNFSSVLKMCDAKVINLLKKHIKQSEGTVMFLQIIQHTLDSFLDPNLDPLDRMRKIWYSTFIVRIWRQYILAKKNATLKDNFLSSNCVSCIEINAHNLVKIILYLRENDACHLFQPQLFTSQPCESGFRQMRSMTTTESTVVNCTVKEMLERLNKIQLQNEIKQSLSGSLKFPRIADNIAMSGPEELPSKEQIIAAIEESKGLAINHAKELGLIGKKLPTLKCPIVPSDGSHLLGNGRKKHSPNVSFVMPKLKNIQLKNYESRLEGQCVDEKSSYVEACRSKGRRIIVRKTSLCWLLREEGFKLSSDRLQRVKAPVEQNRMSKTKKCKNKNVRKKVLLYNTNKKFKNIFKTR